MPTAHQMQEYFAEIGLLMKKGWSKTTLKGWSVGPAAFLRPGHPFVGGPSHYPTLRAVDRWWRCRTAAMAVADSAMRHLLSLYRELPPDCLDATVQWLTSPTLEALYFAPRRPHVPVWLHDALSAEFDWRVRYGRDQNPGMMPRFIGQPGWRLRAARMFANTHSPATGDRLVEFSRRVRRLCLRMRRERLRRLPCALLPPRTVGRL